eukprot:g7071.t1
MVPFFPSRSWNVSNACVSRTLLGRKRSGWRPWQPWQPEKLQVHLLLVESDKQLQERFLALYATEAGPEETEALPDSLWCFHFR